MIWSSLGFQIFMLELDMEIKKEKKKKSLAKIGTFSVSPYHRQNVVLLWLCVKVALKKWKTSVVFL